MANTNCLAGIRCPECGYEDRFFIEGMSVFEVLDDGTEGHADIEWTSTKDGGTVRCGECGQIGDLDTFGAMTENERERYTAAVIQRCYDEFKYLRDFVEEHTHDHGYTEFLAMFPEEEGKERK